jgi:hypothetical protein
MSGEMIGFTAVLLTCGIPVAAIYAWYRVRKLRSEERLAAIAKGVEVPPEPVLPHYAKSRRAGILLVAASIGYSAMLLLISRFEPEAAEGAAVGILPAAIGIGCFIDAFLLRREMHTAA